MARKCSSCGNNGHNSRTCGGGHGRVTMENSVGGGGGAGVRLFGVQLHAGSLSSPMKKCFSMECLSSAAPPAYYAAALAAAAANNNSSSPSVSSSSSLVSVEETAEKVTNGYLSDGLMGRAQERKKGVPWTEDEHRRFLAGLEKLGKGDWRGISRHFVTTRTPTQVASHAQKYFLRQSSLTQKKRRSSLFDVVENADRATMTSEQRQRLRMRDAASSAPDTEEPPALSLGISSSRPAKPDRVLPHPSLSSLLPRCSSVMSTSSTSPAPKRPVTLTAAFNKPHPASIQQAPDLELKISTTADHHQAGSSPTPRTPPFFGTIRVT